MGGAGVQVSGGGLLGQAPGMPRGACRRQTAGSLMLNDKPLNAER